MKQRLGLVSLVVRDYDEALAFFVGKLGFTLVEDRYVPEQSKRWVVVSPPGATESRLLLACASSPEQETRIGAQTGGRVFLFLYTDDFWRDYERYKGLGIEFVRPPTREPYGTVAVFKDLYGNLWDLLQPAIASAATDTHADEFVLPSAQWPAMPHPLRSFLESALPKLRADARLSGLAAGGSFIRAELDEHSDLDLIVVSRPDTSPQVLRDGPEIARGLGSLLAAFPGDHVGEVRLLICLYGPPLIHVDLKFVSTEELVPRIEDPTILWDRDGSVRGAIAKTPAVPPQPRFQWIEDGFWVWMHYIATKIARGELFEAIDALTFVRARVLGSLALFEAGEKPSGMRRVEQHTPARAAQIESTLAAHDRRACLDALQATITLYTELRERVAPATLVRRSDAERAVHDFIGHRDD